MLASAFRSGTIDRLAIGLSGLCMIHCVASVVLVTLLASAGGVLLHPAIHEIGLLLAVIIGTLALGMGVMRHGLMLPTAIGGLGIGVMAGSLAVPHGGTEAAFAVFGVLLVALAHDLNRRAAA